MQCLIFIPLLCCTLLITKYEKLENAKEETYIRIFCQNLCHFY